MTQNDYLRQVLVAQSLAEDSDEVKALKEKRREVETFLREEFAECSPTIRYGGSRAKGTMIRASYDLDLACYFPHEDDDAGNTLQEIYRNTRTALEKKYLVEAKTSALRLKDKLGASDFHVDVVPGRFVDGSAGDAFIYQASAEKSRLLTNLDTHIAHIRDSGVTDAIKLMKFWPIRNGMQIKTFVLELLVVDLLKGKKSQALEKQLTHIWNEFRDHANELSVKDPANPEGNDLSPYLDSVRPLLQQHASTALGQVAEGNWEAIFGAIESEEAKDRARSLTRIAATVTNPSRPWFRG